MVYRTPRFMTDAELKQHFGVGESSLRALRRDPKFPQKMRPELTRTDSRAVDHHFDIRSGIPVTGKIPIPDPF